MHTFSVEDGDAATMSSTAQKNRFASSWFALRLAGMLLIGLVLGAVVAAASHFSFANAMAGNRDDGMRPFTEPSPATASTTLAPVLGDGTAVEWWFAFKPTTAAFPRCSRNVSCMFGGEAMAFENPPRFGLQYILASRGLDGTTQPLQLHSDCIGNGEDPLAKTFQQIYSGAASNYVLWNDQFYDDPVPDIDPPCVKYCAKPWGHSKGFMAWQEDGTGFVVQVTTPDWPGSGGSQYPRKEQGNTLGCCEDDNVMVAQHFFALRLNSANDTLAVLQALHRASVVTDTKNPQLVKLTSGPSDLKQAASQLGQQVLDILEPFQGDISARNKASKVHLIAKPSGLQVPPWHLVSSLLETPLRTTTWWTKPAINSTHEGYHPGCWHESLKPSTPEVQVGLSGRWQNTTFSFLGVPKTDGNHAKLGHSLSGRKLAIMSDMNQQGALDPDNPTGSCDLSQNSRGGLFFVVEDPVFHAGLVDLMTGETAAYVNGKSGCGGAGILWTNCKRSDCRYVKKADIALCNVTQWGCYNATQLPQDCPTDDVNELEVVGISTPAARTV